MKQIKYISAIVILFAMVFSGCNTYSFTSRSTKVNQEDINVLPMLVDVRPDFSKRIVTESRRCKSITQAKEEAKYQAVINTNCDVIVDPVYKIEKSGSHYRAYLTGFAGYYKNPRTIYEDIMQFKDISTEDIEKYLILQNPNIIGMLNPPCNTEVINVYEGGEKVECQEEKLPSEYKAVITSESTKNNKKK